MTTSEWIIAVVAALRIAEATYANRNAAMLLCRGGIEYGRGHYPLFILLYAGWFAALWLLVPADAAIDRAWFTLFVLLQLGRYWVLLALGPRWTIRVVVMPDMPLVRRGPYRWMRHPNYAIVGAEIVILPLVFGAWEISLVFGALIIGLLTWRIRVEDRALQPQRTAGSP